MEEHSNTKDTSGKQRNETNLIQSGPNMQNERNEHWNKVVWNEMNNMKVIEVTESVIDED